MSKLVRFLEFGDFCLDTNQRILLRAGKRVALSQKPLAILLLLVENRHRIVTKDELMEQVWPGVVVEETNITTNISRLRRALTNGQPGGEKGNGETQLESSQFIETISGYGYQFVAEVRVREVMAPQPVDAPVPTLSPEPPPLPAPPATLPETAPVQMSTSAPSAQGFRGHRLWFALAGVAGLTMLGAWLWRQPRVPFPFGDPARNTHREIASWKNRFGNDRLLIRVSPDGKRIAYSKSETGQPDIFIQAVGAKTPTQITLEAGADYDPVWSPDGNEIAYLSLREDRLEVNVMDLLTRQRKLIRALDNRYIRLRSWSKQGRKIFYTNNKNLFTLELDSQQITNLTNFNEDTATASDFSPSPDEQSVVYVQAVNGARRLFTASLDGRQPRQLTFKDDEPVFPTWFGDNQHILYGSKSGDSQQLSVVALSGGHPVQLTSSHETILPYQISPDSKRIFYAIPREESDLYRHTLNPPVETQLVSDAKLKLWPAVAPDGQTLVFQRTDTLFNILQSTLLTGRLEPGQPPAELGVTGYDARWSPRGEAVAFLQRVGNETQLWLLNPQTGTRQRLSSESVLPNGFNRQPYEWLQPCNFSWSPDGSQVAYVARTGAGYNLKTVSVTGQGSTVRTQNTDPKLQLTAPLWSPDGTRIAYLAQPLLLPVSKVPRSVMVNDGARDQVILRTEARVRMLGWTAHGQQLLVGLLNPETTETLNELQLQLLTPATGQAQTLAQLPAVHLHSPKLSPDGKLLAFSARQNDADNLWLFSLADRRLKKLTANTEPHLHYSGLAWLPDGSGLCYSKQASSTTIYALENFN
jgi:Tol biopolymer transport system component/DNA-binding winged helix-turn-helix (wHTH) protein